MRIIIQEANLEDAKELAKIHLNAFDGFFMSRLGYDFLKTYYRCFIKTKGTICYIAKNEDEFIGFVLGCSIAKDHNKKVLKTNFVTFCLLAIKILFKNPADIIRLAKNMTKIEDNVFIKDDQNYAQIGFIGVKNDTQKKGIGYKLFCEFEKELRRLNITKLSLTTDKENNINTLASYNKWGLDIMYEFISYPNRKMYRLIKEVK